MAQSLGDFIAGLTWPLRGRRVVQEVEKKLQEELHVLRWQELQAVRSGLQDVRSGLQDVRSELQSQSQAVLSELQAVRSENDAVRQTLQNHFQAQLQDQFQAQENRFHALEKLMRGNFSHLHDRIAAFQESEKTIRNEVSTALDRIEARSKAGDAAR